MLLLEKQDARFMDIFIYVERGSCQTHRFGVSQSVREIFSVRGHPRRRNRVATCVVVIENGVEDRVDVIAAIRSPRSRLRRAPPAAPPPFSWRACSRVPPIRPAHAAPLREKFTRQTPVCTPTLFLFLLRLLFSSSFFFSPLPLLPSPLGVVFVTRAYSSSRE